MNELVALPENIDQSKAKRLFDEFTSAWEKTPLKDKIGKVDTKIVDTIGQPITYLT